MNKKVILLVLVFITFCSNAATITGGGANNDEWIGPKKIFTQHQKTNTDAYRIPAITATKQGTLIAVADARANGTSDIGLNKEVHFAYKLSSDEGGTWGQEMSIVPDINGKHQVSDPAIVHNSDSGSTFLFGFYNDRSIVAKPVSEQSDFFMFKSDDGGKTWDKGISLSNLVPEGYKYVFQGPGSGMYYKGTIYIGAQAWHHKDDSVNGGTTATSGIIFSSDNGKTWSSAWLRPGDQVVGKPGTDGLPDISSESNVFHHDGYVYLSVKPETQREVKKRIIFRTKNNGGSWERVNEEFVPNNISQAETSSLSLDDKTYLVAYTTKTSRSSRDSIWITSNKGKTVHVFDAPVNGYTSMTMDKDYVYILFEGVGDIYLNRYKITDFID